MSLIIENRNITLDTEQEIMESSVQGGTEDLLMVYIDAAVSNINVRRDL